MAETAFLFDPAPPAARLNELYLGIKFSPSGTALAALAEHFYGRVGTTGKPYGLDRLHLSLPAIGSFAEIPANLVAEIQVALAGLEFPSFDLSFDRVMAFAGPKSPFVALSGEGSSDVRALVRAIGERLVAAGIKSSARGLNPHVTLFYHSRPLPETMLEQPIRMRIQQFELIESLHGQSRHRSHATFPLVGR